MRNPFVNARSLHGHSRDRAVLLSSFVLSVAGKEQAGRGQLQRGCMITIHLEPTERAVAG